MPDMTRSDAYRLLAACFYEPDREMFLAENLSANLGLLLKKLSPPAEEHCRRLQAGLHENDQEALLLEYTRLFLGPFGAPAHPYGSVYLEPTRRLMGNSTLTVQRMYQESDIAQDIEGPPDHIALELEFMSYLAGRTARTEAHGHTTEAADLALRQHRFYNLCLAPWTMPFCEAIRANTQLLFYQALADCLASFVSSEMPRMQGMAVASSLPAA